MYFRVYGKVINLTICIQLIEKRNTSEILGNQKCHYLIAPLLKVKTTLYPVCALVKNQNKQNINTELLTDQCQRFNFTFFVLLRTAFSTDKYVPLQCLDIIHFIKKFLNQFPGLQLVQPNSRCSHPKNGLFQKLPACRTAHPQEMSWTPPTIELKPEAVW